LFSKPPRLVLVPLMALLMRVQEADQGKNVSLRALIPTQHGDMQIVQEMSDTLQDYASLQARVLLMGGTKGPSFLRYALDRLSSTLPPAQRRTFAGLAHDGPENDGRPEVVAEGLRHFFREAEERTRIPYDQRSTAQ